jgi:P27 family predicted phage terminase small subunit
LKVTRDNWNSYWSSRLAQSVDASDMPAIIRLFTMHDERERAYRAYRKERLVLGSKGQMVISPLARVMTTLDAEIRQMEDRLGMTPKARAQLGISFTEAVKSMSQLNAALEVDDEVDPRK